MSRFPGCSTIFSFFFVLHHGAEIKGRWSLDDLCLLFSLSLSLSLSPMAMYTDSRPPSPDAFYFLRCTLKFPQFGLSTVRIQNEEMEEAQNPEPL